MTCMLQSLYWQGGNQIQQNVCIHIELIVLSFMEFFEFLLAKLSQLFLQ